MCSKRSAAFPGVGGFALIAAAFASVAFQRCLPAEESATELSDKPAEFAAPELLYLTWQENAPRDPNGKYFPVWKPDGELLSDNDAADLRKQLRCFAVFKHESKRLHPLVMVFKVDKRAKRTPVMPRLIDALGQQYLPGGSLNEPRSGMILSSLFPSKERLFAWPRRGTIDVRYPVENPTIESTLDEAPAGPLEVAKGVTWELKPYYVAERDPKTGRYVPAAKKLRGVLSTDLDEIDPNVDYDVRFYLKDQPRPWESYLHTSETKPGGQPIRVDISRPVENLQLIERIEIIRQRYAKKQFENVHILRNLLSSQPPKAKIDE